MISYGDRRLAGLYIGDQPISQAYIGDRLIMGHPALDDVSVFTLELTSISQLALAFSQSAPEAVSVDWGDGTPAETFEGEASTAYEKTYYSIYTIHNYENPGTYELRMTAKPGTKWIMGDVAAGYGFAGQFDSIKTSTYPMYTAMNIGSAVEALHNLAINGFTSIEHLVLPDSVQYIGYWAFYGCTSLTEVTLPQTPFYFELIDYSEAYEVFRNCTALERIDLAGAVHLGSHKLFSDCTALRQVYIRENTVNIWTASASDSPFTGCNAALLTIYCEADEKPSGWGEFWNRCGADGADTATVVWGQKTRPW